MAEHVDKQKHCSTCDYTTCSRWDYNRHLLTDKHRFQLKTPLLYDCLEDNCHYFTRFKSNLVKHIDNRHNNIKLIKCAYCNYSTNDLSSFSRHSRVCKSNSHNILHIVSKNFKCLYCSYQSNRKNNVSRHIQRCKSKLKF